MPLDNRTRATFRRAEFGFLGVIVFTCKHTPRFWGQPNSAGCFGLRYCCRRGLRTSWFIVGISPSPIDLGARRREPPCVVKQLPYCCPALWSREKASPCKK